jgi:hypothetical protein
MTDSDDALAKSVLGALPEYQKALDQRVKDLYETVLPRMVVLKSTSAADPWVVLSPARRCSVARSGDGTQDDLLIPNVRLLRERRTWADRTREELQDASKHASALALKACDLVLADVVRRASTPVDRVSWKSVPPRVAQEIRGGDSTRCVTIVGPGALESSINADEKAKDALRPCRLVTWDGDSTSAETAPKGRVFVGPFDAVLHTAVKPTLSWDRTASGLARITVTERSCLVVGKRGRVLEIC